MEQTQTMLQQYWFCDTKAVFALQYLISGFFVWKQAQYSRSCNYALSLTVNKIQIADCYLFWYSWKIGQSISVWLFNPQTHANFVWKKAYFALNWSQSHWFPAEKDLSTTTEGGARQCNHKQRNRAFSSSEGAGGHSSHVFRGERWVPRPSQQFHASKDRW